LLSSGGRHHAADRAEAGMVGVTVKLPELVAVPPDVVMMMLPVFVLLGQ